MFLLLQKWLRTSVNVQVNIDDSGESFCPDENSSLPKSTKVAWLVGTNSYQDTKVKAKQHEGKSGHFCGSESHILFLES